MRKIKLPHIIQPCKDALRRRSYRGYISCDRLSRLNGMVDAITSDADADFTLYLDPQGLVVIEGSVAVCVNLVCQRCNQSFEHNLLSNFKLCALSSARDDIPSCYEVVEVNEFGEIDLTQTLVDELILSLPLVAKHEESQCEVHSGEQSFGEIPDEVIDRPNPFAKLAQFKKRNL